MARFGSASAWLYVGGYNIGSNSPKGLSAKLVSEMEETTGIGVTSKVRTPVGLCSAEVTQEGAIWSTGTNLLHTAFVDKAPTTPQATVRVACLGFGGQTIGEMFYGFSGNHTAEYEVVVDLGVLQKGNITHSMSGRADKGRILQELEAKTIDWDTESTGIDCADDPRWQVVPITSNSQANPSVVTTTVAHGLTSGDRVLIAGVSDSDADINGEQVATVVTATTFTVPIDATTSPGTGGTMVKADSSLGGYGYMHVTACTGFTNFVGTIVDSDDDITYGSLGAFADNVSAPFSEVITVAVGQVERFIAFDGDVTGTGSITVWAGFART